MRKPRIIFFDIDGTLIDMEKKQVTPLMLDTLHRLKDEYSRILQDVHGAKIAAWWDRAVDIIPTAGGKGNGIAVVLQAYGIPKADAMAFGDGNNDLEMFGAVGTCVAMANGSADLKAAATHLCGSCAEDGIYHFCAENGLI